MSNELEITEVWKDIKTIPYCQAEWPFHQVSNRGRIRVLPGGTVVGRRRVTEIEFRKIYPDSDGYMRVSQGNQGKIIFHQIHILVLNQFVGPCPPEKECCRHLNGNPADNRWPENLEWGTFKENQEDRVRHGTSTRREGNGRAKLTNLQILEIKKSHLTQRELAKEYKVSQGTISKIQLGQTWVSNHE
jgi:hypothetical protein